MATNFNVTRFEPTFDGQLTVNWSPEQNATLYRTRLFRLAASVEVSIDNNEQYEIGFIQVSSSNHQSNYYTSGATQRWELYGSALDSSGYSWAPVNDSESDDQIPWYNIKSARTIVRGPVSRQVAQVDMNDNFNGTVSWTEAGDQKSYLYRIMCDQSFDAWLVVHRIGSSEYTALRHTGWKVPVDIQFLMDFDGTTHTSRPNHSWLDKAGVLSSWQPSNIPPIPSEAFRMPRVNAVLALFLYPADGSQKRIVAWAAGHPPG
jgi:hypothetical protein